MAANFTEGGLSHDCQTKTKLTCRSPERDDTFHWRTKELEGREADERYPSWERMGKEDEAREIGRSEGIHPGQQPCALVHGVTLAMPGPMKDEPGLLACGL